MGRFYEDQKNREDHRQRRSVRREKLASYFFDVSKLSLGGVVFTSAFGWFSDRDNGMYIVAVVVGLVITIILAIIANKLLK